MFFLCAKCKGLHSARVSMELARTFRLKPCFRGVDREPARVPCVAQPVAASRTRAALGALPRPARCFRTASSSTPVSFSEVDSKNDWRHLLQELSAAAANPSDDLQTLVAARRELISVRFLLWVRDLRAFVSTPTTTFKNLHLLCNILTYTRL